MASYEDMGRPTRQSESFVDIGIALAVVGLCADSAILLRVEDDQVGVGTGGDHTFLGV